MLLLSGVGGLETCATIAHQTRLLLVSVLGGYSAVGGAEAGGEGACPAGQPGHCGEGAHAAQPGPGVQQAEGEGVVWWLPTERAGLLRGLC